MRESSAIASPVEWLAEKNTTSITLIIGAFFLAAVLAATFIYLLAADIANSGEFPPGVSVAGVRVSGLSRNDAVKRCERVLEPIAKRPLSLEVDDEKYQITPEEIGLRLEHRKMVEEAYRKAWSVNIFERMFRRFVNRPRRVDVGLMAVKDETALAAFVERALGQINRHPRNAFIDVTSGTPVIVPAKDGREADFDELLDATGSAVGTKDRTVKVRVKRTPAPISDSVFGRFIIINLASHTLSLYERQSLLARFPVACGSSAYPTPAGIWKIVSKQRHPAWRNPGSAWAASMPPYIPPGPRNPLGTRALALNASGVLIHGTPSPWSIGRSVSHGCVRMYMHDVEALFEMVEVNTPVYVIKAAGNPGFDVTQTPKWMSELYGSGG